MRNQGAFSPRQGNRMEFGEGKEEKEKEDTELFYQFGLIQKLN